MISSPVKIISNLRAPAFFLILCLFACTKQSPPPDHPRLTPKVTMADVTFRSLALDRDAQYRIILPADLAPGKKFFVVYLLHGGGGTFRDWSNYSDVARFAEKDFILVMPEGGYSYYTNAVERPKDRYEDFVINDLIADVEDKFPAAHGRENRAIIGVSMGGFGAVKLALRRPELFSFAAGISSAIDVPSRPFSMKRLRQSLGYKAIFGPAGSQTRRENDPFVLARSADPQKVPFIYMTCGEQEGLLPANRQFTALLEHRHFRYEFHTARGSHDWNQWNAWLPEVFGSLSQHTGPNRRP